METPLRCPRCAAPTMVSSFGPGGTPFDKCSSCGALWFDKGDLAQFVSDPKRASLLRQALAGTGSPSTFACPRCETSLERISVAALDARVDICSTCGGNLMDPVLFDRLSDVLRQLDPKEFSSPKISAAPAKIPSELLAELTLLRSASAPRTGRRSGAEIALFLLSVPIMVATVFYASVLVAYGWQLLDVAVNFLRFMFFWGTPETFEFFDPWSGIDRQIVFAVFLVYAATAFFAWNAAVMAAVVMSGALTLCLALFFSVRAIAVPPVWLAAILIVSELSAAVLLGRLARRGRG